MTRPGRMTMEERRRSTVAHASFDPLMSCAQHGDVVERLQRERQQVSLRYFPWERPGDHTYRDAACPS